MSAYLDDLKAAFAAGYPVYYYSTLLKDPSWTGWISGYYMLPEDRAAWESYKKQQENCMCEGHKHAALMAEYAKDAAKVSKPWLLWEYCTNSSEIKSWNPLRDHPCWVPSWDFRRKGSRSDLEKYGVEVGDVWETVDAVVHLVYFVEPSRPEYRSQDGFAHLKSGLTELMFRRGVVNKL